MKALRLGILIFGIMAMISCKDSNRENADNDHYALDTPDYNMNNKSDNVNKSDNLNNTDNMDNTTNSIGEENKVATNNNMVYSSQDMQEMYKTLNMSQDQINKFETDFHKKIGNLNPNSTNTMDKEKMKPEMDKSMKEVLTAEQYKKYDQWKKDHPNS